MLLYLHPKEDVKQTVTACCFVEGFGHLLYVLLGSKQFCVTSTDYGSDPGRLPDSM